MARLANLFAREEESILCETDMPVNSWLQTVQHVLPDVSIQRTRHATCTGRSRQEHRPQTNSPSSLLSSSSCKQMKHVIRAFHPNTPKKVRWCRNKFVTYRYYRCTMVTNLIDVRGSTMDRLRHHDLHDVRPTRPSCSRRDGPVSLNALRTKRVVKVLDRSGEGTACEPRLPTRRPPDRRTSLVRRHLSEFENRRGTLVRM